MVEWAVWAQESNQASNENRIKAVERLAAWLSAGQSGRLSLNSLELTSLPGCLPDSLQELDVSDNQLTSLPEQLPTSLRKLYVFDNQLTSLPEQLPISLRKLHAARNQLTSLPALPASLKELTVSVNQLKRLPELPASLREIHASDNQLTELPKLPPLLRELNVPNNQLENLPELPVSLQILYAFNNPLTCLTENITTRLGPECQVLVRGNPLSAEERESLHETLDAPGYQEPSIRFSPGPANHRVSQPGSTSHSLEEGTVRQTRSESSEPRISRPGSLLDKWEKWTQQDNQAADENRTEAIKRMRAWLSADQPGEMLLSLSSLNLTSLPSSLPVSLQKLDVSDNQLSSLPQLPPSLQELDVSNNQLSSLPQLPASLQELDVSNNQLSSLPQLPASLQELDVANNQLTSLPQLPASLSRLCGFKNRLTSLPENIMAGLGPGCNIYVEDNPLSEQERNSLRAIGNAPGYQGPRIHFSMEPAQHNVSQPGSTSHSPEDGFARQRRSDPSEPGISRRSPLQNVLLAQVRGQSRIEREYLVEWAEWVQQAPDENRTEAVERMKAWVKAVQPDTALDLESLGLTSLPRRLPDSLRELNVSDNQLISLPALPDSLQVLHAARNQWLTSLPTRLPASLRELNVSDNQLISLPTLPASLQELSAFRNQLTSLPALPNSLFRLYVFENQLTSLPELPVSLQRLEVSRNQLTSLPENITARLGRECLVHVEGNPLSEQVCNRLHAIVNAPGYQGPRIYFPMAEPSHAEPVGSLSDAVEESSYAEPAPPLGDAVAQWYGGEGRERAKRAWNAFAREAGAAEFSLFLDRLRDTVNYHNPAFQSSVVEWLSHLSRHSTLRSNTFAIVLDAMTSCEDRISLTYNNMKKIRLAFDVENGHYDDRLGELIDTARGMYRLDQLEKIAWKKAQSIRSASGHDERHDEIEVYLAYQVKLRDKLQLPLDTSDMRYFQVSWVTQEDLKRAEQSVKKSENEEFHHYLSTQWQPWQSVLSRLYKEQYDEMQEQLLSEDTMDVYQATLDANLRDIGLENDDDARRIVGPQVMVEIERQIKEPLTREFLRTHSLLPLLDFQWHEPWCPDALPPAEAGIVDSQHFLDFERALPAEVGIADLPHLPDLGHALPAEAAIVDLSHLSDSEPREMCRIM